MLFVPLVLLYILLSHGTHSHFVFLIIGAMLYHATPPCATSVSPPLHLSPSRLTMGLSAEATKYVTPRFDLCVPIRLVFGARGYGLHKLAAVILRTVLHIQRCAGDEAQELACLHQTSDHHICAGDFAVCHRVNEVIAERSIAVTYTFVEVLSRETHRIEHIADLVAAGLTLHQRRIMLYL